MPQIPESTISSLEPITRNQLSGSDLLLLENAVDDFKLSLSTLAQYIDISGSGANADIFNVYGAKNLLPYPYSLTSTTTTISGITFTDNKDGSITVNGTATANITLPLVTGLVLNGTYIVSTQNYISNNSCLYLLQPIVVTNITQDSTLNLNGTFEVGIKIASGAIIHNVRLYPMIRLSSVDDPTYVPYAKTNKRLTDDLIAMQSTFQAGVDAIYNAIVANGVTPSSSTPTACVAGINNIRSGGDATAAQILKTKKAYVNKSLVTGTMENYSGNNRRTVTPAGGTGDQQISLSPGYHDSVIVNRTNPYNAGVTAADARVNTSSASYAAGVDAAHSQTWSKTMQLGALYYKNDPSVISPSEASQLQYQLRLPCNDIVSFSFPSIVVTSRPTVKFYTSAGALISTVYPGDGTETTIPSNADYAIIYRGMSSKGQYPADGQTWGSLTSLSFTVNYRANKMR